MLYRCQRLLDHITRKGVGGSSFVIMSIHRSIFIKYEGPALIERLILFWRYIEGILPLGKYFSQLARKHASFTEQPIFESKRSRWIEERSCHALIQIKVIVQRIGWVHKNKIFTIGNSQMFAQCLALLRNTNRNNDKLHTGSQKLLSALIILYDLFLTKGSSKRPQKDNQRGPSGADQLVHVCLLSVESEESASADGFSRVHCLRSLGRSARNNSTATSTIRCCSGELYASSTRRDERNAVMVESAGRENRTTPLFGRHKCRRFAREQQRCCRSSHWPHGLLSLGKMCSNDRSGNSLTPTASSQYRTWRARERFRFWYLSKIV